MEFGLIGPDTPVWFIVLQGFCYGALSSLQYTSMNTLVYADIPAETASNASSIASTMQQLSMSFGVAIAGLMTVYFLPDRQHAAPLTMVHGLHRAFIMLGIFTILSTLVFVRLKRGDGSAETRQKDIGTE
jgi:MFS family permease